MKLPVGRTRGDVVLVMALFTAVFTGCPEPRDDIMRSRAEVGEPAVHVEFPEGEYVGTVVRRWIEDQDLPTYLKEPNPNADEEAKRERQKKDYIRDHEGTWIVTEMPLRVDQAANRGFCDFTTKLLTDSKYMDQRASAKESPEPDPVKLDPSQILITKIEFRLKDSPEDYLTDPEQQKQDYIRWLKERNCPPEKIDHYVDVEIKAQAWTTNPQTPKKILRYGLPPLAQPLARSPFGAKKNVNLLESRCWDTNQFYVVLKRDEQLAITEPFELLSPYSKDPTFGVAMTALDPTLRWDETAGRAARALDVDDSMESEMWGFPLSDGALPVSWRPGSRPKYPANDWRLRAAQGRPAAGGGNKPAPPSDDKPEKGPEDGGK